MATKKLSLKERLEEMTRERNLLYSRLQEEVQLRTKLHQRLTTAVVDLAAQKSKPKTTLFCENCRVNFELLQKVKELKESLLYLTGNRTP